MWLQGIIHSQVFGVPLWVIVLCGVVGVLVDIDHPVAHYWLTGLDGRFLHKPLLVISSIVFCGFCTYTAGLLTGVVLG